jgi:ABC-type bacteriocin/lantibiotic exporter with double-glycine peptidase domain
MEGRRKALLFEILNGITTIKTLALEPRSMLRCRRYDDGAATRNLCRSITPRRAPAPSSAVSNAASARSACCSC